MGIDQEEWQVSVFNGLMFFLDVELCGKFFILYFCLNLVEIWEVGFLILILWFYFYSREEIQMKNVVFFDDYFSDVSWVLVQKIFFGLWKSF